jgi:hypothetical protein
MARFKSRLDRLQKHFKPDAPRDEWEPTLEERVGIVRGMTASVLGRQGVAPVDPFPELQGQDYLDAYQDWFFQNGEHWPGWAHRIAVLYAFTREEVQALLNRANDPDDFSTARRPHKVGAVTESEPEPAIVIQESEPP